MKIVRFVVVFSVFLSVCVTGATALTPKLGLSLGYDYLANIGGDMPAVPDSEETSYDLTRFVITSSPTVTLDWSLGFTSTTNKAPWSVYGNFQVAFPSQVVIEDFMSGGGETFTARSTAQTVSCFNGSAQLGLGKTYFNDKKVNYFSGLGLVFRKFSCKIDTIKPENDESVGMVISDEITSSYIGASLLQKLDVYFTNNIGAYIAVDGCLDIGELYSTGIEGADSTGIAFSVTPRIGVTYKF
jgi:hypothetical protein